MAKKKTLIPNTPDAYMETQHEGEGQVGVYLAGSAAEQADTMRLYEQINSMDMRLIDFVATTDGMLSQMAQTQEPMDRMNAMRNMMLFSTVSRAFHGGLNPRSIMAAAGTYIGFAAAGGKLSDLTGAAKNVLGSAYEPYLNQLQGINEVSWRSAGAAQFRSAAGRRAFDQAVKRGEMPLSPEAAAVMMVGLDKQAYAEMRAPGANIEAIMATHNKAKQNLYMMAEAQGITAAALDANVGRLVARMGPEYAMLYKETAVDHGEPVIDSDGIATGAWSVDGREANIGDMRVRVPYSTAPLVDVANVIDSHSGPEAWATVDPEYRQAVMDVATELGVDMLHGLGHDTSKTNPEERLSKPVDIDSLFIGLQANLEAVRDGKDYVTGIDQGVDEAMRLYDMAVREDGMSQRDAGRILMNSIGFHAQTLMVAFPEQFEAWQQSANGQAWTEFAMGVHERSSAGYHESAAEGAAGHREASVVEEYEQVPTYHSRRQKEPPMAPKKTEANMNIARARAQQQSAIVQGSANYRRRVSCASIMKEEMAEELMGDLEETNRADGVVTSKEARSEIVLSNQLQAAIANPSVGLDGVSF